MSKMPSSFTDFLKDAGDVAPIMIYRAEDCPPAASEQTISRGSDCRGIHQEWEQKEYQLQIHNQWIYGQSCPCPAGDNCLSEILWGLDGCVSDPEYFLVIPEGHKDTFPSSWLSAISGQAPYIKTDWILVSDDVGRRLLKEYDPLVCIWEYKRGPRPYCQHGGDEDWTAIVRKSVYLTTDHDDVFRAHDELLLKQYLDCCGVSEEDEDDFRVYTGAHA